MNTGTGESRETLEYIRDMLDQLKIVSGLRKGDLLLYLLDMARLEAEKRIAGVDEGSGSLP